MLRAGACLPAASSAHTRLNANHLSRMSVCARPTDALSHVQARKPNGLERGIFFQLSPDYCERGELFDFLIFNVSRCCLCLLAWERAVALGPVKPPCRRAFMTHHHSPFASNNNALNGRLLLRPARPACPVPQNPRPAVEAFTEDTARHICRQLALGCVRAASWPEPPEPFST